MADKYEWLEVGDDVKFQIAIVKGMTIKSATNVTTAAIKLFYGKIDCLKRQFGFLSHEGAKLYFQMDDVRERDTLSLGDNVEFAIVKNQQNGKDMAVNLTETELSVMF